MLRCKPIPYSQLVVKLDSLGLAYHLVSDSWASDYDYHGYSVLCDFYNVEPTSEIIFNNLIDLLDDRFFKLP